MLTMNRNNPALPFTTGMDRLFESLFPGAMPDTRQTPAPFPPVNIWQTESDFHVEAELPGFSLDDVDISVAANILTIRGTREINRPENAGIIRAERGSGAFERSFRLPVEVDLDRIEATLGHGVLHVTLPKSETARPRRIAVRATGKALPDKGVS